MATNVNLTPDKLIKYLTIAAKQRKRAVEKFVQDYGPNSATVLEVNGEIGELDRAIADLQVDASKIVPLTKNK